jgi:hypothetical protein
VRPLAGALAACALFAAPVTLSAQAMTQQPLPPNTRPVPPVTRPHPMPSGGMHHPNRNRNRNGISYPILVDGSLLNRYVAAPTPAPKHTQTPRHTANGEDIFETHSSDDAK